MMEALLFILICPFVVILMIATVVYNHRNIEETTQRISQQERLADRHRRERQHQELKGWQGWD